MKQFYRTLLLLALPLVVAGCNTDYNFDNVSLEVTVGDTEGIVIPVGRTGSILLSDLLSETEIGTTEEGYYGFSYDQTFEYNLELGTIPHVSGIIPALDPITNDFYGALDTQIPIYEATRELSIPEVLKQVTTIPEGFPLIGTELKMHYDPELFEATYEITLPEQVAAIEEIHFGKDGQGSLMKLTVDLGSVANVSENRIIEKLNIELPDGFTITPVADDPIGDYVTIYAGQSSTTPNHYHIENYPMTGESVVVEFYVKSLYMAHHTISESGTLIIDESVTYDLDISGTIKAGSLDGAAPSVKVYTDLSISDALIYTNEIAHEVSVAHRIEESIEIPAEIERIDYLSLASVANPGDDPRLNVSLGIKGAPVEILTLKDVELSLPPYFDLEIPEGWSYDTLTGKLTIPSIDLYNNSENEIFSIAISGLTFLPIANGQAVISADFGLKATAFVAEDTLLSIDTSSKPLQITPIVSLDDFAVTSFTGRINPDFSGMLEPIEVEIGDFGAELDGLEMELNISSPKLHLSVLNPIGVALNADVKISAVKGGQTAMQINTPTITINSAVLTEPTLTDIHIVGSQSEIPEGAEGYYVVEGLVDMIGLLPEKLLVEFDLAVDHSKPNEIVLKDLYRFVVSYDVAADLCFDANKEGHISYTTTVENIDLTNLADIEATVESLVLNIDALSTLPIALSIGVEMLDAQGQLIESITATTEGAIEGSTTSEAAHSNPKVTLSIAAPEGSTTFKEIAKIAAIRCRFDGTTLAGGGLRPDQYIDVGFSLLLDKGITVDLGDFLPEEEVPEVANPGEPNLPEAN